MSDTSGSASAMEAQRVVVREGKGLLQCPACREAKTVSVLRLVTHRFNVRCLCGHVFAVQLEFRQKHRKKTNLLGYYKKRSHAAEWAEVHWETEFCNVLKVNCRVVNLTAAGIGFVPLHAYEIKTGDFLSIRFVLDDSAKTVLLKKAVVRVVREQYIGCEFSDEDKNDKKIGFYLLE